MAAAAVSMLAQRGDDAGESPRLDHEVVIRESTAPPP
jgi:hypothetical protein